MIEKDTLFSIRNGICAVGFVTVPRKEYLKDPNSPFFKVVGTAFMVRDTTAMTNRHVIDGLLHVQRDLGFADDQRIAVFVTPGDDYGVQVSLRQIRFLGTSSTEELDVGFIEFKASPESQNRGIAQLPIQKTWSARVADPIAVSGYPYGHFMLQRDQRVYRWGPVTQQGYISAISPFDTAEIPDQILLDVRTAEGMSGAPIFLPQSGLVIGMHHSGWEATTALGLPFTSVFVEEWIDNWDTARDSWLKQSA